MLPFGVAIPATVPQGPEIPEGLMNNAVYYRLVMHGKSNIKVGALVVQSPPNIIRVVN